MLYRLLLFYIIFFFFTLSNCISQGKFKKIEKQASSPNNIPNSLKDNSESDDNDKSALADLVGYILFSFPDEKDLTLMYGTPIGLSKNTYTNNDGRYTRVNQDKSKVNLDLQFGYFFESNNLHGFQSLIKFQFIPKVSIDVQFSSLMEKNEDDKYDYLNFTHANISYHRFAFTRFDFWIGTGYTNLKIENSYHGWNINFGTEIFIKKPLSLYSSWYVGGLEELNFTEGDVTLKAYFSIFSLLAGYQYYSIGETSISGPKLGVNITL